MNWLDVVLILTIAVSIASGLFAGFARTGVSFLASILALILGLQYYRTVGVYLHTRIHDSNVANVTGFLIVYFCVVVLGSIVSRFLARFVRATNLFWLDSVLGGVLGVVRGGMFAVLTIWALMAFAPEQPKAALSSSRLTPYVMDSARRVADASPDEVRLTFRRSYRQLNKVLPEGVKDRLAKLPPNQL